MRSRRRNPLKRYTDNQISALYLLVFALSVLFFLLAFISFFSSAIRGTILCVPALILLFLSARYWREIKRRVEIDDSEDVAAIEESIPSDFDSDMFDDEVPEAKPPRSTARHARPKRKKRVGRILIPVLVLLFMVGFGATQIGKIGAFVPASANASANTQASGAQNSASSGFTIGTTHPDALSAANQYLATMPFSHDGLIHQLEYEGYTNEDATYAADNCGADWNQQALLAAVNYLDSMPFSSDGLAHQLEYERFTSEQAAYGVENCGADWNEQALLSALKYLDTSAFSESGLSHQLEFENFTAEQAQYAIGNCGADWNEQAKKSAEIYLSMMEFSREELISQLEFDGFTHDQAVYGAEQNGF